MSPAERFEIAATALVLTQGLVHGATLIDLAVHCECGATAKDQAERWLTEAVTAGWLEPRAAVPNHSQRAWSSLGNCATVRWEKWERCTAAGWTYATIGAARRISHALAGAL